MADDQVDHSDLSDSDQDEDSSQTDSTPRPVQQKKGVDLYLLLIMVTLVRFMVPFSCLIVSQ